MYDSPVPTFDPERPHDPRGLDRAAYSSSDVAAPPRPLLRTRPVRRAVIATNVMIGPVGCFARWSPGAAMILLGLVLVSLVLVMTWSAMVVSNVGRVRSANLQSEPPRPALAAASWLLAPALMIPGWVGMYRLDQWVDDATVDQQGGRSTIFAAAVIVAAVTMMIALYQPYRILGRASAWVSSDRSKFRKWFTAPYIAALVGLIGAVLASLSIAGSSVDELDGPQPFVAVGFILLASILPWLAWVICGSRAMIDLEEAVGHQHRRLTGHGLDVVMPMNPLMAAQAAAQSYVPVAERA
jgi:hypothetical protein